MRILRRSYIWNTLSATAYASMSFFMTLVTIYLCGEEAGGIFSIAFSSSQMLQTLAKFGMRNYQATDVTEQFSAGEYVFSRIITSLAMMVGCGLYTRVMRFEAEKRIIYLFFCGVNLFDALSDVIEGSIHRKGRLDIASQSQFLRTVFLITVFIGALLVRRSLILASLFSCITAALGFFLCSLPMARKVERVSVTLNYRRIGVLLLQCLPLFLVAAANSYIINAPKIMIDLHMEDQAQAQFAIVFMPVFVINMVSSFIFRPQLNTMAVYFAAKEKKHFQSLIRAMTLIDIGLTLIALGGTYVLGVPVLSWIYGVEISGHKDALLLIVLSGGFCALTNLLSQTLTAIRRQKSVLVGYLFVSLVTAALSNPLVKCRGILGAAILYFFSMVLMLFFLGLFYIQSMKELENS